MREGKNQGQSTTSLIVAGVVVIAVVLIGYMWFSAPAREPEPFVDDEDVIGVPLGNDEDDLNGGVVAPANSPGNSPTAIPTDAELASPEGNVKTFTVSATNFKFTPADIRVNEGDTVRLTLTNNSSMPHDWRVDELNVATDIIAQGRSDTIEFVATQKGTFESYCSVGNHRQQGMVGKLIVE